MTRRKDSNVVLNPTGVLTARPSDSFVEALGINISYGASSYYDVSDLAPGVTRTGKYAPQGTSVDTWVGHLQNIGFRYVRLAIGTGGPYGDGDPRSQTLAMVQRDLQKLEAAGVKCGHILWRQSDYTRLRDGLVPTPAWIEGANEPYGFGEYYTTGIWTTGTPVTWASLGTTVNAGTLISDGIGWYCRQTHTKAGGAPSNFNDWGTQNNNWIPIHMRSTQLVEAAIDDIYATRGYSTRQVPRLGPSVYCSGSPAGTDLIATALIPRSINTYGNLHEYKLQAEQYDYPANAGPDAYFQAYHPYQHPYERTSLNYLTESMAYRSGPADGYFRAPELETAYLHIRGLFAGLDRGLVKICSYQLLDEFPEWGQDSNTLSTGLSGIVTNQKKSGNSRLKIVGRMLKNLIAIFGERGVVYTQPMTTLRFTWGPTAPLTLSYYLYQKSDGRLLVAYANRVAVFSSKGGSFDTATGLNDGDLVQGTPGQYQNGSVVASVPAGFAVTVNFDRGFSRVRNLASLDSTVWTELGALPANTNVSLTLQPYIQIIELTP